MNLKQWSAVILLCVAPLTAEAPRNDAGAYTAHANQGTFQIGASLLTHNELKKIFATDVNKCCLVVEVAFYPSKNNFVKISLDDFMLREVGLEVGTRPSTAEVLAARLEDRRQPPDREHRPGVTTSSEVGYERERYPTNDGCGNTRTTSRGGVYQRESVGVGIPVGGKSTTPEISVPQTNRRAIEAELGEKGLPEVSAWEPVAGYIYFSLPKKSKNGYELVYMSGDNKVVLPLKQ
jgi:hypothetical protein